MAVKRSAAACAVRTFAYVTGHDQPAPATPARYVATAAPTSTSVVRLRPICESETQRNVWLKECGEGAKECADRHAGQTNASDGTEQSDESDLPEREVARHRSEAEREQHERGDRKRRNRSTGGASEQKQHTEERDDEQCPPQYGCGLVGKACKYAPQRQRRRRSDERQQFVARSVDAGNGAFGTPDAAAVRINACVECDTCAPIRFEVALRRTRRGIRSREQQRGGDERARQHERDAARHYESGAGGALSRNAYSARRSIMPLLPIA